MSPQSFATARTPAPPRSRTSSGRRTVNPISPYCVRPVSVEGSCHAPHICCCAAVCSATILSPYIKKPSLLSSAVVLNVFFSMNRLSELLRVENNECNENKLTHDDINDTVAVL